MCRIMINDMSSRTALRSLIRGGNNGEDEAIRQVNATAIRREIQANRNDIVDIKQQIAAKETRISQIDKKIEYNEKLIVSNEKVIDKTEKLIASNEELIAKEEDLLKDLVESRDLDKEQIGLMRGIITAAKSLLKIKQEKAANASNPPMKDVSQPLPQQGQAASVVTSQQTNDMSAKSIDSTFNAAIKKGKAKPLTKSDYKSLRAGAEKIVYSTLGKDNKYTRDIRPTNEPEESYSRFSSMFKAYRAEMKSIDRMFSFLRIKV